MKARIRKLTTSVTNCPQEGAEFLLEFPLAPGVTLPHADGVR